MITADGAGPRRRRVLRNLLRHETLLDPPQCDVALPELEAIAGSEGPMPDFLVGNHARMEVEVAPCVTSTMRWPPEVGQRTSVLSADQHRDAAMALLSELADALSRADSVYARLSDVLRVHSTPGSAPNKSSRTKKKKKGGG